VKVVTITFRTNENSSDVIWKKIGDAQRAFGEPTIEVKIDGS
jgi:hypothetical protein